VKLFVKFGNFMSKIGRKPIIIPDGVDIKVDGLRVSVKGPKGELQRQLTAGVKVEVKDGKMSITIAGSGPDKNKVWGLERALLNNMVVGVSQGFQRKLEVNGVGYRAAVQGKKMNLALGFSHPIEIDIPAGIEAKVQKNIITLTGIDKQALGQFAANIKSFRPPEPYKGKGIKYAEEQIRRKEGKKVAASESGE
jgi:large subunit ribosomal protein L6